jgi:hypothetical protein
MIKKNIFFKINTFFMSINNTYKTPKFKPIFNLMLIFFTPRQRIKTNPKRKSKAILILFDHFF